ncbi:hypothetical protein VULLAG_LOCUS13660 [Vulpes lagopus]
MCEYQAGPGMS